LVPAENAHLTLEKRAFLFDFALLSRCSLLFFAVKLCACIHKKIDAP
jgi:hypothetical protein